MFNPMLLAATALVATPAAAQTNDAAAQFGVRESVLDISLSPSGTNPAYVAPGPANVSVGQARITEGKLKADGNKVEPVVYPKLDPQIDSSAARTDILKRSDDFLRAALKLL